MEEIREDIIDIYSEMNTESVGESSRSRRRARLEQEELDKAAAEEKCRLEELASRSWEEVTVAWEMAAVMSRRVL